MRKKKIRLILEYPINSTIVSLFSKISTQEGLRSWFADRVEQNNNEFTFFWNKIPDKALLIQKKENVFVRFRWKNDREDDGYFFEMRVDTTELAGLTSLVVTDFAEEHESQDTVSIWENNVKLLKRCLGVS